jgi:hypothetical protein
VNAQALLQKAKGGDLSPSELAMVAKALGDGDHDADPYDLLLVLGHSNATQYRSIVEQYLRGNDDPMVRKAALEVLCRHWDLTGEYLDVIRRALKGLPGDEDGDLLLSAVGISGEYLREHSEPVLLETLLGLFRDVRVRQIVREAAYGAIARAVGRTWNELPSAARHFDLETEIDRGVITLAEGRLAKERS